MKVTNLELIQSYVFTAARYDFSIYEKRIMYCILRVLQAEIEGKKLNEQYSIQTDLWDRKDITIPIIDCLGETDKNYARIKKAARDLENKRFEYEDDKTWQIIRIINMPKVEKNSSTISFTLQPEIVTAFLNFSKGYRKYIFEIAMNFDSVYSMRFYELFSNKFEPITYSIDKLKEMFQITNKYKLTANFKAKVLDVAKKELDEKSPFSFAYKMLKTGRKETHVLFTPYKIPKNQPEDIEQKELNKQVSPYWTISKELIDILLDHFDYDRQTIKNHKKLLELATQHLDFIAVLRNNYKFIMESVEVKPAFIYSLFKKKLAEKGISVDGSPIAPEATKAATPEIDWESLQKKFEAHKKQ